MTNELTVETRRERRSPRASGFVFGLVLVGMGVVLMLDRMDVAPISKVGRIWPVALIGAGAAKMWESWHEARLEPDGTTAPRRLQSGSGMGLMTTGLWFLVVNFGFFGLSYHNAWPLLIVGVGISIMWRAFLEERGGVIRREHDNGR